MRKSIKQVGQGMTEYIIIVALIAIAAIGVYSFFGDALRGQMGAMTQELTGADADRTNMNTAATEAVAEGAHKDLSDYDTEK